MRNENAEDVHTMVSKLQVQGRLNRRRRVRARLSRITSSAAKAVGISSFGEADP